MDNAHGLTDTLVSRALSLRRDRLDPEIADLVRQSLKDTLAVTLAGASEALPQQLCADALREDAGCGPASIIGSGKRLGLRQAALVNGAAAHALDFDDVNLSINGHPSAVIWPAVLAVAQARDSSGEQAFMAFLSGYEFACRVGRVVEPGHYDRGYHATSSVGVLGATLACARLMQFTQDQALHAVGIAATMASGLKAMFGTPCKPLHAGLAARNAVEAVLWAQQGLTSRPDILECERGFARTLSPDFRVQDALDEPDRMWIRENLFKYHAACYGTHSAIEAALALRRRGIRVDDIHRICIRVEKVADTTCNIADPRTPTEAKFSLRLAVAMALLGLDTGDLDLFSTDTIGRADLQRLRQMTQVELVDGWSTMDSEVILTLGDASQVAERMDTGLPCRDLVWQGERLAGKFTRLTTPVLGPAGSAQLAQAIEDFERFPIRRLMDLCQTESEHPTERPTAPAKGQS
jgi:2-methylcitrate dehydratase PrpD